MDLRVRSINLQNSFYKPNFDRFKDNYFNPMVQIRNPLKNTLFQQKSRTPFWRVKCPSIEFSIYVFLAFEISALMLWQNDQTLLVKQLRSAWKYESEMLCFDCFHSHRSLRSLAPPEGLLASLRPEISNKLRASQCFHVAKRSNILRQANFRFLTNIVWSRALACSHVSSKAQACVLIKNFLLKRVNSIESIIIMVNPTIYVILLMKSP